MNKRIAQLFIILVPFFIFICLLYIEICPLGIKTVHLEIGDSSPYIYSILPDDRVSDIQSNAEGEKYISILSEPTYFNVKLPNTEFDQVEVEIEFDSAQQSLIELGALTDIYSENYDLKPIVNKVIDDLEWSRIQEGATTLLQREHKYSSVSDFVNDLPGRDSIGVYQYDLSEPYIDANYTPLINSQTIDVSLRGYHKYLTYIKDEPFYLDIYYMDMNRTTGADDAVVRVRDTNDKIVFEYFINDDGDIIEDQVSSKGTAIINESGWSEGVYSVELSGTSDIFWRSITTAQKYMTFVGKIYIADDVGYLSTPQDASFYTDAKHISFETTHSDSIQNITIGKEIVDIASSHEKYEFIINDPGVVYGYSPCGDIKISGDGKFAFSKDMFFNPDPVQLNAYSNIDSLAIDYIITNYQSPQSIGNWAKASALFGVDKVADLDGFMKFIISTPGVDVFEGDVNIHSITVKFIKGKMSVLDILSALRDLLPFGI